MLSFGNKHLKIDGRIQICKEKLYSVTLETDVFGDPLRPKDSTVIVSWADDSFAPRTIPCKSSHVTSGFGQHTWITLQFQLPASVAEAVDVQGQGSIRLHFIYNSGWSRARLDRIYCTGRPQAKHAPNRNLEPAPAAVPGNRMSQLAPSSPSGEISDKFNRTVLRDDMGDIDAQVSSPDPCMMESDEQQEQYRLKRAKADTQLSEIKRLDRLTRDISGRQHTQMLQLLKQRGNNVQHLKSLAEGGGRKDCEIADLAANIHAIDSAAFVSILPVFGLERFHVDVLRRILPRLQMELESAYEEIMVESARHLLRIIKEFRKSDLFQEAAQELYSVYGVVKRMCGSVKLSRSQGPLPIMCQDIREILAIEFA